MDSHIPHGPDKLLPSKPFLLAGIIRVRVQVRSTFIVSVLVESEQNMPSKIKEAKQFSVRRFIILLSVGTLGLAIVFVFVFIPFLTATPDPPTPAPPMVIPNFFPLLFVYFANSSNRPVLRHAERRKVISEVDRGLLSSGLIYVAVEQDRALNGRHGKPLNFTSSSRCLIVRAFGVPYCVGRFIRHSPKTHK